MLWVVVPFVAPPIADLALVPWQDWALLFIGCALGIPSLVMGLTLGAMGTSFPNLYASVLTARAGQAVGIGHDREQTLIALQRVLPRLETRGFRFVPVSQLLP